MNRPYVRCNRVAKSFNLCFIVQRMCVPVRLFGERANGRQQIRDFLSPCLPFFLGQTNCAHIALTPLVDDGDSSIFYPPLFKQRFEGCRILHQHPGDVVRVLNQ